MHNISIAYYQTWYRIKLFVTRILIFLRRGSDCVLLRCPIVTLLFMINKSNEDTTQHIFYKFGQNFVWSGNVIVSIVIYVTMVMFKEVFEEDS